VLAHITISVLQPRDIVLEQRIYPRLTPRHVWERNAIARYGAQN